MREAVAQCELRVALAVWAVHGLQVEMLEVERREALGQGRVLRIDELELVPLAQHELRARLGAHAHPVESSRRVLRPVRLYGDLEPFGVERIHQRRIEL